VTATHAELLTLKTVSETSGVGAQFMVAARAILEAFGAVS